MIAWIKKHLHIHEWETTHESPYFNPTRQVCSCGLSREFQYRLPKAPIGVVIDRRLKCHPMSKEGHWVWSNGVFSTYR